MWSCPVCGKENPTMVCGNCSFDGSCDYERYPTITRYPAGKAVFSRQKEADNSALRCPNCGSKAFSLLVAEQRIECLQCGIIFDQNVIKENESAPDAMGGKAELVVAEAATVSEEIPAEETIKEKYPRWLIWAIGMIVMITVAVIAIVLLCVPSGWETENGATCYYDNMQRVTGLQSIDGKTYYFDDEGIMQIGWQTIAGDTYYFSIAGAMQTGRQHIDGDTYYFDIDGHMQTAWQTIDGDTYFFDADGSMHTGWQNLGTAWYYFDQDGRMLTGTQVIDGETYEFGAYGTLVE
ncbi:MAG: N-acetylmuramoyl-L-alanine amidase family protein [Ruminococcaceae bacterium]|nr:N-acetylmuramoyl-L-alanine amidase family protein [Oscillospiraceae bacterium]